MEAGTATAAAGVPTSAASITATVFIQLINK